MADLFKWWYSRGWAWAVSELFIKKTEAIASFFSIGDLLRTLFAPFRQDSINVTGAPIGVRLQVFGGNIISRFLGLLIRTALIFIGLIVLLVNSVLAVVGAVLWPLLPLSPLVAFLLFMSGVGK